MSDIHIKVRELVGENATTMDDGDVIYSRIISPLTSGQTVVLDFDGVQVFGASFFNYGIGRLLGGELTTEMLNSRLKFDHLSDFGSRVLRRVIENAKDYYEQLDPHHVAWLQDHLKAKITPEPPDPIQPREHGPFCRGTHE